MTSTLGAPGGAVMAVSPESWRTVAGTAPELRRPPDPRRPRTLGEARRAAGLTLTDVARALHASRPTVSLWERGDRRPARDLWPLLGAVLGLGPAAVAALFADHPPARLDGEPLPSLGGVRRRAGLTGRALAQLIGVAPTTLSMWETAGIRVPPGTADELARVLDTDVATLAARPPHAAAPDPRPLRGVRRAAGMSQREAAAHLGIAPGTLARYEAGERRLPVAVARRMARLYRRPAAEVLGACGVELCPLPPGVPWRPQEVPGGLRAARGTAGLTKVALGRAVGRSGQAVRNWETGRTRPGPATCRRLEVVLRLGVGTLPF